MVKPALSYLDVIHHVREASDLPIAAYNVSGEYAMVKAAGAAGMCDDFGLAYTFARLRVMRIGDGPDEVHNRVIARNELQKYKAPKASEASTHG